METQIFSPIVTTSCLYFCEKIVFYKLFKIEKCGGNIKFASEGVEPNVFCKVIHKIT